VGKTVPLGTEKSSTVHVRNLHEAIGNNQSGSFQSRRSLHFCQSKNEAGVSWPRTTALGIGNRGKAEDGGFPSSSHCHLTSSEMTTGRDLRLESPEQSPGEAERHGIAGVGAAALRGPALGEMLEAGLA